MQQVGELDIRIGLGQFFHAVAHRIQESRQLRGLTQSFRQEVLDLIGKGVMGRIVLMNNHGSSDGCCTGGVGILMLIRGLRERHQNGWCVANGEFTDAPRTGSADGEIGMLQQGWDLVAEASFRQQGMVQLIQIRIIATGEMHNTASLCQQRWQDRADHLIQANGALTAAHHHQQGTIPLRNPIRQGLWA